MLGLSLEVDGALPITHIDPLIKFKPHFFKMGLFHHTPFFMQSNAGYIKSTKPVIINQQHTEILARIQNT